MRLRSLAISALEKLRTSSIKPYITYSSTSNISQILNRKYLRNGASSSLISAPGEVSNIPYIPGLELGSPYDSNRKMILTNRAVKKPKRENTNTRVTRGSQFVKYDAQIIVNATQAEDFRSSNSQAAVIGTLYI